MILLDTHVLVWLAEDDPRLGERALSSMDADEAPRASAMSYWELAMLVRKGRCAFAKPVREWLDEVLRDGGIQEVPVTSPIAADAGALPRPLHGDPSDRIIVATARALGCPLVTADGDLLAYAAAGHLRAVDARR